MAIPLVYANIDPTVWGEDAFEFNHNRPGLKESLGFGGRHVGQLSSPFQQSG